MVFNSPRLITSSHGNAKDIHKSNNTFELDDLTTINTDQNTGTANEEWFSSRYDDRSFLQKLWYGPLYPEDKPPKFHRRWRTLELIDDYPRVLAQATYWTPAIRYCVLAVYLMIWSIFVGSIVLHFLTTIPSIHDSEKGVITLACNQPLEYWKGNNNACGIGANGCRPFDDAEVIVRCPALCDRSWIYSAVDVGRNRIKYKDYTIGGGITQKTNEVLTYPYRGDSAVCSSAYHAGLLSASHGGCLRISMSGAQNEFPSTVGKSGWSIPFDSFFPSSYVFAEKIETYSSGCYDPRLLVMIINVILSLPVFFLYDSLTGYWVLNIVAFWTLVLIFDPPIHSRPENIESVFKLFSIGFERLLPFCFVLYVIWKVSVKRTLEDGSPLIKLLVWFPMFWLGVMNNITFDRLPIDRLTPNDIQQLSGALATVISLTMLVVACAIVQAYSLWKSGRLRKYFFVAIPIVCGAFALAILPGLSLRIHHYVLGLVLVVFCSTRNVASYLFQGILIGLIVSGVSTWGFASIVETNISLLRGEPGASLSPPVFTIHEKLISNVVTWSSFNKTALPSNMDGFSLLINDVERYVGSDSMVDIQALITADTDFAQMLDSALSQSLNNSVPLYMRVAHVNTRNSRGERGDYSRAGRLDWPEGSWQEN